MTTGIGRKSYPGEVGGQGPENVPGRMKVCTVMAFGSPFEMYHLVLHHLWERFCLWIWIRLDLMFSIYGWGSLSWFGLRVTWGDKPHVLILKGKTVTRTHQASLAKVATMRAQTCASLQSSGRPQNSPFGTDFRVAHSKFSLWSEDSLL